MRTVIVSQVTEGISYDVKRMGETGVSPTDISNYLKRKSLEMASHNIR